MEMKSVPPVVASAFRQMAMAKPLMMPPNTLISRLLSVSAKPGIRSTSTLLMARSAQENSVNFLPMNPVRG